MSKMNLGFSNNGNNWKLVIGNFLITFGVQAVFKLEEIINQGRYPTEFECCKIGINSLAITLIFYGYNRYKNHKAE